MNTPDTRNVPPVTIAMLESFPALLGQLFQQIPVGFRNWVPDSWDGIPSESFTGIEHICHLRDIEIDGYQVRLRRMLEEAEPNLDSIDGYALSRQRKYAGSDPITVLLEFRRARHETLERIRSLSPDQFERSGYFEAYGRLTVQGLLHYLCSHDQQHLSGMHWLLGKIHSS